MTQLGEGGCSCGAVRYCIPAAPLFVHCCHCAKCQTETGSGFAINALIERSAITIKAGAPIEIAAPGESGQDQAIIRCPDCATALWSHYPGMGRNVAFIRAGTLDGRTEIVPNVHIYTRSKLPWIRLPQGAREFEEYYPMKAEWPAASWARLQASRKPSAE